MKNFLPFSIILFIIISVPSTAQRITRIEKQILSNVEKNHEASIEFLKETVNINSGTFNREGVKKVGAIYRKMLDEMGFTTQWVDMPDEMNRAGHLIAEIKGTKGKKLLLIGHIDTVFEPDAPFQEWERRDTVAVGPGSNDMKGGNMVLLYALKAMHEAGQLKDRQIIVVLHGDEENAGSPHEISRRDIIEAAQRSDAALAFETGTGFNYATVARRGSMGWTLTVKGKQAHSSGIFTANVGAGSVYEASRILNRFYEGLQEEYLTFNPGLILGGTDVKIDGTGTQGTASGKTNLVANTTIVKGDLRFLTEDQRERAQLNMQTIVRENLPQTEGSITFNEEYYPSMPPTEGNMELLNTLSQISKDLGQGEVKPYDPGRRGAGDISFVAQYVDGLDGLGVIGGGAHAPGEWIHLPS
ncbi:MAG TPA: M20/M25/M40 family metallo-hydrolase, partial [Anditalea sp.]|nr:M20/M25/M40 family metallo-hydrolase [Anditalea sp.]